MPGRVFEDPVGDVEQGIDREPALPPGGVGDLRAVSLDVEDGVLSISAAFAALAPAAEGVTVGLSFATFLQGRRDLFTISAGTSGSVDVFARNDSTETNRRICRGEGDVDVSPTRGLVRMRLPVSCLGVSRLTTQSPEMSSEVNGPGYAGVDEVSLPARGLVVPAR